MEEEFEKQKNEKNIIDAINKDNLPEFAKLVENDPNFKLDNGNSVLQQAIIFESYENIQHLLNHEKIDVNKKNNKGDTALHIAAVKNVTRIIADLLKHKQLDVNIKNLDGKTPLHIIAKSGNKENAKLFLNDIRTQIDIEDDEGNTALYHAILNSRNSIFSWSYWTKKDDSKDREEIVRLLVNKGAKIDDNILNFARKNADPVIFNMIKDKYVKINISDDNEHKKDNNQAIKPTKEFFSTGRIIGSAAGFIAGIMLIINLSGFEFSTVASLGVAATIGVVPVLVASLLGLVIGGFIGDSLMSKEISVEKIDKEPVKEFNLNQDGVSYVQKELERNKNKEIFR